MNARSEPPFRAPWEAQAFALVEHLIARGLISASDWANALGASIRAAQTMGDPDTGETYYRHWLTALESILHQRNLASLVAVEAREAKLSSAAATEHGPARSIQSLDTDETRGTAGVPDVL